MAHLVIHQDKEFVFNKLTEHGAYLSDSSALLIVKRRGINLPMVFRQYSGGIVVKVDNFPIFLEEDIIEEVLLEIAMWFESVELFNFKRRSFPHNPL